jgi:exodeoxyribonuclease VII small subunit
VAELEQGDLPLEESLKIFEEGVRLSKSCLKILEEAERKVEVLVQDKEGKKRLQAYSPDAEEADA